MISVGEAGRHSDGGIFAHSAFGCAVNENSLGLPEDLKVPNSAVTLPHVFIGDAAFSLKNNFMRPYPGRYLPLQQGVFNYRLSRARRTIENSFGILVARWRIFLRPIIAHPDNVMKATLAACALHNFVKKSDNRYCPSGFADSCDRDGVILPGEWRNDGQGAGLLPWTARDTRAQRKSAGQIRDTFAKYFMSPVGEVEWQYRHVTGT